MERYDGFYEVLKRGGIALDCIIPVMLKMLT